MTLGSSWLVGLGVGSSLANLPWGLLQALPRVLFTHVKQPVPSRETTCSSLCALVPALTHP